MSTARKPLTYFLALLSLVQTIAPPAITAAEPFYNVFSTVKRPFDAIIHREKPETCKDEAIQELAREIDWLEHHIDAFGSIVAKNPDVWGESRLTQHREEFEKQMATQLDQFHATINGALRRSDQSYLSMAMALQAASGKGTLPTAADQANATTNLTAMLTPGATVTVDPSTGKVTQSTTSPANQTVFSSPPFANSKGGNGTDVPFDASANLSLEPNTYLDQMANYLKHLQELRRINEGDDTADSPGYALDLVRIPVSILPGKHTRRGFGAEITVTATPYLSQDLLPSTFRNLVIKDVVDLLAPVITRIVNCEDARVIAQANAKSMLDLTRFRKAVEGNPILLRPAISKLSVGGKSRRARLPIPPSQFLSVIGTQDITGIAWTTWSALHHAHSPNETIHLMDVRAYLTEELQASYEFLSKNTCYPMWDTFCSAKVVEAIRLNQEVQIAKIRNDYVAWLGKTNCWPQGLDEFKPPEGCPCVNGQCSPTDLPCTKCQNDTSIGMLSWIIMVESALLNAHLAQDMRDVAISKGCCINITDDRFFGPNPSTEARETFLQYVQCRWPIHVFAIEPTTEDQNIADEYSRRRELQLSLAAAFAGGQIGGQAMMRYSRRLEWDMATIALNRTQIAFSHGDNTFGWRFYPRFQSPPIRGTVVAFGETLFGGPTTDQDTKQRELEPGMRECVAIVVMPSFVPYVTFDTHTNWFKLTNPKHSEISTVDMLKLSRSIKSMQNARTECMQAAGCYRDGEVQRLMRRVSQLDHELPLQTMQVQIPFENNLGGFEMFNNGVTDLSPELIGWYGEPGIDRSGSTRLFLMGDKFTVRGTHVIAGNRPVEFTLLSRQVMEVNIPAGCQTIEDPAAADHREVVDVHLGTSYGVTSHLLIPVAPRVAGEGSAGPPIQLTGSPIKMAYYETPAAKPGDVSLLTIQDFFDTDRPDIVIDMPPTLLIPAANMDITFTSLAGSTRLGDFQIKAVPFDSHAGQYYLSAGALVLGGGGGLASTPAGGLKAVVTSYLNFLNQEKKLSSPVQFTVRAALNPVAGQQIPVGGTITVTVSKVNPPKP